MKELEEILGGESSKCKDTDENRRSARRADRRESHRFYMATPHILKSWREKLN